MNPRLSDARATLALAWPIMVTQLAQVGTGFVDATMAGHYSALDLAAISVGGSVWIALMLTLIGFTLAVNPLVAHCVGADTLDEIPGIVQQGLWQNLFFAVCGIAIGWLVAPYFHLSGLEPESAEKAGSFLRAVVWGLPALAIHRVLAGYSASLNQTRPMMFIALFGLTLNIPVNWILIYGKFGDDYAIIASKGGAPSHPGWFLNMEAADEVAFQVAEDHFTGSWRVAEGEERARIWAGMVDIYPPYTDYEAATSRRIPVVVLTPTARTETL